MQLTCPPAPIHLRDNPLLREPLKAGSQHQESSVGTTGARTLDRDFLLVHLNRLINKLDLNTIYISGPRARRIPPDARELLSRGTLLAEIYPDRMAERRKAGLPRMRFFLQFSFPAASAPLHAGDAGLDPRRRRARLQPVACLRRGASTIPT